MNLLYPGFLTNTLEVQYPGISRKDCWRYVREIQGVFVNWKEATQILLSILPTSPVNTQRALHRDWLAPFPFESCDQAIFSSGEHKENINMISRENLWNSAPMCNGISCPLPH